MRYFFSKQFIAPVFIFLVVFSFSFLFTYSIHFFWEDIFLFGQRESLFSSISMISNLSDPALYHSLLHNYSTLFLFSQDVPLDPPEQDTNSYYYHGNIIVEDPWVIRQLRHLFYDDIYYSQFLVYQYVPHTI